MAGVQLHLWAQWRLKQASAQLPELWVLQMQCLTVAGWVTRSAFLSAALHIMSASLAVCTPVFLNAYRTSWARPAIPDVTLLWYSGMSLCTSSVSTWSWLSIRENACWVCGRKPYSAGSSAVWRNEDANGSYLREPNGSVGAVMLFVQCTLGHWDGDGEQWQMRLHIWCFKKLQSNILDIRPWEF